LVGGDVPVVRRPDRYARPLRGLPGPPLRHGIGDLPQVGGNLLFLPFPPVVVPLMASTDLHAGVLLPLEFPELVVSDRNIRGLSISFHGKLRSEWDISVRRRMLQRQYRRMN